MKKELETYNRVKNLETHNTRYLRHCICIILLFLLLAAAISFFTGHLPLSYSSSALLICCLLFILLLLNSNKNKTKHCRFCNKPLNYIIRPFLFDAKYLSMEGIKEENHFFTHCRWGPLSLSKRWVKICNRSLACHHCRLSEEQNSEHFESPTKEEIEKVTNSLSHKKT